MAYVQIAGQGLLLPELPPFSSPAFSSSPLIDATGEKIAFVGPVFFKAHTGSKTINKVHFRVGSLTKAGGSGWTVSLQSVSLTSGPPIVPSEVQDQFRAIAAADLTANTWFTSGLVTSDGTDTGTKRTVNFGELLAVVLEYDAGGRLGADSLVLNALGNILNTAVIGHQNCVMLKSGAGPTWAQLSAAINVVLEFSDGTFGTLDHAAVANGTNTHSYNSGTGVADEYANAFTLPFPCKVDGGWAILNFAAGADVEIILYDGTTAQQTVTVDSNAIGGAGSARFIHFSFAETALTANHTYYLSIRPTTANSITAYSIDVNDANHWDTWPLGQYMAYTTRLDLGAWAATTTTRRLMAGLRASSLDDGTGGAGGSGAVLSRVRSGY